MCEHRGLLVVPAAPALVNIQYDAGYRDALLRADMAIADSGFMVLLWRLLRRTGIRRVSGLVYLKELLARPDVQSRGATLFVLPSDRSKEKALGWLREQQFQIADDDTYVAPFYGKFEADETLLALTRRQRPRHIVIGLGGGVQERVGLYLRDQLDYRPAIHCIGAALGFLTGDQKPIPPWADRLYLGWLLRLARNPKLYLKRFWLAHELPGLIATYGSRVPDFLGV